MVHKNIAIQGIAVWKIPEVWGDVSTLLEPAINEHEYDISDVLEQLQAQDMQLWVAIADGDIIAALTTRLQVFPKGKVLLMAHMGGEWDAAMADYLPRLKEFGKAHGATSLRLIGRRGWVRVLQEHLQEKYVLMESIL